MTRLFSCFVMMSLVFVLACESKKPSNSVCGNKIIEGSEICDKNLKDCDKIDPNYISGTATCEADCNGYDVSACVESVCGNKIKEGVEVCEQDEQIDCGNIPDKNYMAGTMASCKDDCTGYDESGCVPANDQDIVEGDVDMAPDTTDDTQPDGTVDSETPDIDTYDEDMPDTDISGPDDFGTMVDVPAGEFWMGCNEAIDNDCSKDEKPYHAVTLLAYKIGKYEVTVGEYQQCVTNGACNNGDYAHYYTNTDYSGCNYGVESKRNHPMQCVTWYGAKAYCEWIGGRLPTETEWEKAARGTDGRKYPWGNTEPTSDKAVYSVSNTMDVGSKPAGVSPYGAYDMAGNVWEWVNDWYAPDYYASSPTNNPAGPETGDDRVLRGGSWFWAYDYYLRTSHRYYDHPGFWDGNCGFRCAK